MHVFPRALISLKFIGFSLLNLLRSLEILVFARFLWKLKIIAPEAELRYDASSFTLEFYTYSLVEIEKSEIYEE